MTTTSTSSDVRHDCPDLPVDFGDGNPGYPAEYCRRPPASDQDGSCGAGPCQPGEVLEYYAGRRRELGPGPARRAGRTAAPGRPPCHLCCKLAPDAAPACVTVHGSKGCLLKKALIRTRISQKSFIGTVKSGTEWQPKMPQVGPQCGAPSARLGYSPRQASPHVPPPPSDTSSPSGSAGDARSSY
ncbi:hypothetical protein IBTHAUMO2_730007 [Nitrosopumilaceae archaeon]|nr:hypothetical protein IBTHAUMO2_730007 [Nitrosopumilaceae archaeon]